MKCQGCNQPKIYGPGFGFNGATLCVDCYDRVTKCRAETKRERYRRLVDSLVPSILAGQLSKGISITQLSPCEIINQAELFSLKTLKATETTPFDKD